MTLAKTIKRLWSEDGPMIAAGEDVAAGLSRLCARCHEVLPHPMWRDLPDMASVEGDVREFQTWLTDTLIDFPPSHQLKMFWFGIVEDYGIDDVGSALLDDELATADDMTEDDDDEWFDDEDHPDDGLLLPATAFIYICGDRYLFTEPRPVERQKGYSYDPPGQQFYPHFIEQYYQHFYNGDDDDAEMLATNFLLPAYTGLLISWACRHLDPQTLLGQSPRRQIVFGWDEGEPIILGEITRQGWLPRYQPVKF